MAEVHAHKHPIHHKLTLAFALGSSTLALLPYLITGLGIEASSTLLEAEQLIHPHSESAGYGIAGSINTALSAIPMIGQSIATGTFFPILASGFIGIGGVLLGNWLEGKMGKQSSLPKIVKSLSLMTSAIIALPSLLSGISTGLAFLGLMAWDNGTFAGLVQNSIGVIGNHAGSVSALGATVPHLLICGASILPVSLAYLLGEKHSSAQHGTPAAVTSQRFHNGYLAPTPFMAKQ